MINAYDENADISGIITAQGAVDFDRDVLVIRIRNKLESMKKDYSTHEVFVRPVKLPKLSLPEFRGEVLEWSEIWDPISRALC